MNHTICDKTYPTAIKWTRQRKDVYHILKESNKPLSVHEIYNRIIKENENTNYAVSTIYRILTAFEGNGLVIKSTIMGEDMAVYELNKGEHRHYAICLNCHKRIPLKACPMEHSHMSVKEEEFKVTGHKVEVYGYCKDCN